MLGASASNCVSNHTRATRAQTLASASAPAPSSVRADGVCTDSSPIAGVAIGTTRDVGAGDGAGPDPTGPDAARRPHPDPPAARRRASGRRPCTSPPAQASGRRRSSSCCWRRRRTPTRGPAQAPRRLSPRSRLVAQPIARARGGIGRGSVLALRGPRTSRPCAPASPASPGRTAVRPRNPRPLR